MVLFLAVDVGGHHIQFGYADRETGIAGLPRKLPERSGGVFFRGGERRGLLLHS